LIRGRGKIFGRGASPLLYTPYRGKISSTPLMRGMETGTGASPLLKTPYGEKEILEW
jgi:hypothetical protein